MATFLAVGGLEGTFRAVLDTFRSIPIGAMSIKLLPVDLIIGTLGSAFDLALRVSAPVMAITFLLLAAFGFLGRTMPQFNVINLGFTIKIIAAIAILAVSLSTTNIAIGEEITYTLRAMLRWAHPHSGGIHG
jgi:flagellar biosynthetic protein FliR